MSHPRPGAAALKSVCFALFAAATSMSCVFAILPSVGRGLGLSETQLGWVVAPAALVFVLFGPVWGRAGQHLGARAIFTSTLTLLALFTLLFGHTLAWRQQGLLSVSACFGLLLLSRLLLSPFSAAMLPTAQSFIAHSTEGTGRTRGLAAMGASFALGMVASPGLAAVAVGAGMLAPFYLVAVLLLLAAGLTWRNLPHDSAASAPRSHGQAAHARTAWSLLWQPLSVLVLLYAVYGILMQVTGFRLQDQFHLDAQGATQWAGAALMATAAALVAAQMVLARAAVTDPQRQRRIAAAGAVAGLAGLLSLLFDSHLAFYLLAMAAFGLSLGIFMPFILSMLTTRAQAAGDQSRVGGLSGAAQGLGMVIGPLLGAASYRFNVHLPYALALVALALGSMLYGLSSRAPHRF